MQITGDLVDYRSTPTFNKFGIGVSVVQRVVARTTPERDCYHIPHRVGARYHHPKLHNHGFSKKLA
jgi:hypothetical protein